MRDREGVVGGQGVREGEKRVLFAGFHNIFTSENWCYMAVMKVWMTGNCVFAVMLQCYVLVFACYQWLSSGQWFGRHGGQKFCFSAGRKKHCIPMIRDQLWWWQGTKACRGLMKQR